MEDIIEDISSLVDDIRTELDYAESQELDDQIREYCRSIDCKLSELTDAIAETEEDEFCDMVPADITAGDAISLKETINNWRREHGYGEL